MVRHRLLRFDDEDDTKLDFKTINEATVGTNNSEVSHPVTSLDDRKQDNSGQIDIIPVTRLTSALSMSSTCP